MDLGKDLGTPSPKPILEDVMQLGSGPALTEMAGFQFLQSHQFHYSNPFIQVSLPQQDVVLLTLVPRDPFDETIDQDDAPIDLNAFKGKKSSISDALSKSMSTVGFRTSQFPAGQLARQLRPFAERFRFHCILNAPTAMIKHADENPATYLNKGYTYYLSVADTSAMELLVQETINQAFKADRDFGKRKHSVGAAKVGDAQGRSRMQKHKRTWPIPSVSSADEGNSARASSEEDFHFQLQTLQDMFTSTRSVGALYLRGEELDDSDLHPVLFPGDACPMTRLKDCNRPNWQARLHNISPQPGLDPLGTGDASRKGSKAPTRIRKTENDGVPSGWIEALEVDPLYEPPEKRGPKPAVCSYVLCRIGPPNRSQVGSRPIQDKILRTLHSIHKGFEVEMVRKLGDGQDMTLEVDEVIKQPAGVNREWEMAANLIDNAPKPTMNRPPSGFVLRLAG
ncbi:hypothetical protein FSARC_13866 [Fusarium sarcochroum]|uniref:Grh/CP2 DB domain-containing protein n=1 Tax=Fusarium sarcochroum TaxID=1208366 RepID=A0A8H4SXZ8_9HYPO|nr:hypothetical protein FSARC_13866 [Fusarium sarcochroum]